MFLYIVKKEIFYVDIHIQLNILHVLKNTENYKTCYHFMSCNIDN